jgi:hypothetical protein
MEKPIESYKQRQERLDNHRHRAWRIRPELPGWNEGLAEKYRTVSPLSSSVVSPFWWKNWGQLPVGRTLGHCMTSVARISRDGGIVRPMALGGLEVDRELESGGRLHGKVGGLGALEDLVHEDDDPPPRERSDGRVSGPTWCVGIPLA